MENILTPDESEEDPLVLTLGTLGADYNLIEAVAEFNRKNKDISINLLDYNTFNTPDNFSAGAEKLDADIDAGNAPDIIKLEGLSAMSHMTQGAFTDLRKLIDGNQQEHGAFLENILSAFEIDGKLYQLPASFQIEALAGITSAVGQEGWSFADSETDAPFGLGYNNYLFLESMLRRGSDDFVNWPDKTCNFDSAEFIALLEYCLYLSDNTDSATWDTVNALQDGSQILNLLHSAHAALILTAGIRPAATPAQQEEARILQAHRAAAPIHILAAHSRRPHRNQPLLIPAQQEPAKPAGYMQRLTHMRVRQCIPVQKAEHLKIQQEQHSARQIHPTVQQEMSGNNDQWEPTIALTLTGILLLRITRALKVIAAVTARYVISRAVKINIWCGLSCVRCFSYTNFSRR